MSLSYLKNYAISSGMGGISGASANASKVTTSKIKANKEDKVYRDKVGYGPEPGNWVIGGSDEGFYGHSKVNKQNIVKNPPQQVPQLGKDGFYSNVKNITGKR